MTQEMLEELKLLSMNPQSTVNSQWAVHAIIKSLPTLIKRYEAADKMEAALRKIQSQTSQTRGKQAYGELPMFVIRETCEALKDSNNDL